jgi:hypothetical protein
VETLVYSLNRDELLWSSMSRTINPRHIDDLVNEVAHATAKEMVKQRQYNPSHKRTDEDPTGSRW